MSTAPSWFHQWIVWQLMDLVGGQARRSGLGFPAAAPIGVFMPGCDPVQPDFLLVRSERSGIIAHGRVNGVPDLIAEVLSPSQPSYDTDVKRQAYARAGVPEYWIVRPASREVTIYWQPNQVAGEYAGALDIPPGGELASPTLPIRLAIAELFAGSPDTTV
jgi:Uma2 family endonuclease